MSREKLVLDNQRLITYTLSLLHIPYNEDDFSVGQIGLVRASKTYDKSKGKFSTYAIQCIKTAIFNDRRKKQINTVSLETQICEDITLGDVIADNYIFEEKVILKEYVSSIMKILTPTERKYITNYFGLNGNRPCTFKEIAKKYNVSYQAVQSMTTRALQKMRKRGKLC